MAKKKTAEQLREEALKLLEASRDLEKQEKLQAKREREKAALKIGKLVLDAYDKGWSGFSVSELKKQVEAQMQPPTAAVKSSTAAETSEAPAGENEAHAAGTGAESSESSEPRHFFANS